MSIDLRPLLIDVEDQRHYNSCVGQSIATYYEAIHKKFTGESVEFSPAFAWYVAKQSTENKGVSSTAALHALKKQGICREETFPYTDENLSSVPPKSAFKEAKKFRIGQWAVANTAAEVTSYLSKGLPVYFAIALPDGFHGIRGPLETHPAQWRAFGRPGRLRHAMCIFGVIDGCYLAVNSYDYKWGDRGCTLIPISLAHSLNMEAYVITRKAGFFNWVKSWF